MTAVESGFEWFGSEFGEQRMGFRGGLVPEEATEAARIVEAETTAGIENQVQVIVFQLSVAGFWLFVTTKILFGERQSISQVCCQPRKKRPHFFPILRPTNVPSGSTLYWREKNLAKFGR
jgi:hypothetical protein